MNKIMILIGNIRHILNKNKKDNISAISGQSAFFILLSLVPLIMFIISLSSMLGIGSDKVSIPDTGDVMADSVNKFILAVIQSARKGSTGMAVTTLIVALWSAGKGLYALTDGISRIYGFDEKRPWVVRRLFSRGYTLIMLAAIIATLIALVLFRFIGKAVGNLTKDIPFALEVMYGLRYLIAFVIIVLIIAFSLKLYLRKRVENKKYAKLRVQLPGAIFTTLCCIGFSYGIEIYISMFNGFSLYGSLAGVVIFMIWIYFMVYIFLIGVQINYVYRLNIYILFTPKALFGKNRKSLK